jgi:hypothetical protein
MLKICERSRKVYENKENGWKNVRFFCTMIGQIARFSRYFGEIGAKG